MDAEFASLPDHVDALKAALLAARADVARVTAEAAAALAEKSSNLALIAHLKLQIEKLNRDRFGPRSERTARLLDQMELQLEELETAATQDELAAEFAAAKTTSVVPFTRARPARRPFPEHLPRECVVVPGPVACACCGGTRLSKLGEDLTETLEAIPAPGRSSSTCGRSSPDGMRAHQPGSRPVPRDPARLGGAEPGPACPPPVYGRYCRLRAVAAGRSLSGRRQSNRAR